jgi:hypothetical protein
MKIEKLLKVDIQLRLILQIRKKLISSIQIIQIIKI